MKEKPKSRLLTVFVVLFILFLVGTLMASVVSFFTGINSNKLYGGEGNVAVIPLKGLLLTDDDSPFMGVQGQASSTKIVEQLEEAAGNREIKAIVLEINSPGGSGVAADDILAAMDDIKQNKTIVAWVRDIGTSAAYWVSMGTNHTIADRLSVTGSIGVIGSYLEYAGLLERFNVTYRRLVSGKYKDTGSPYREITEEELALEQQKLVAMHDVFIRDVAKYRNLDVREVRKIATGMAYLGSEALELGLIDEVGGKKEVVRYLESHLNASVQFVDYQEKKNVLDWLRQLQAQGMLKSLMENGLFLDTTKVPLFS
ncbi:MAG TPA: signal peptide peptidase SppA [Candidatus Nanoarchaeia archaeon]|nr:signal peptide peptidase SppA [Candidatus Nanoarchaeia archaeon]